MVAASAWESRKPGQVGWGLGHAVVAQNRRAVYADGHAQMYGTHRPAGVPPHRGLRGSRRRGALLLGPRQEADGHGGQRRLPVAGGGGPVGRERRLLARGPRAAPGPARQGPPGAGLDGRGGRPVAPPALPRARRGADAIAPRSSPGSRSWRGGSSWPGRRPTRGPARRCMPTCPWSTRSSRSTCRCGKVTEAGGSRRQGQGRDASSKDPRNRRSVVWYQEVVDRFDRQKAGASPTVRDGAARRSGWATWRSRRIPSSCSPTSGSRSRPAAGPSRRS